MREAGIVRSLSTENLRPLQRKRRTNAPATALALRLLGLSVVSASASLLPLAPEVRPLLIGGILAASLLESLHYLLVHRQATVPGELFVLGQVGIWTFLMSVSGGQRSPFLVGYLLEVPLAGLQFSRRGCVLAAGGGAGAYLAWSVTHAPLDAARAAAMIGFLLVSALLTWLLIGVLERQERRIAISRVALETRAENLTEELRLLGDYLNGALLSIDDLGCVVEINPAGMHLLGFEAETPLGRPWQEVLRPDPAAAECLTRTLAEGVGQRGLRLLLEGSDGRRVSVEAEIWSTLSGHGRRTHVLMDAGRRESGAVDPLRRLGEATAVVSHQIKNSLHALEGFTRRIEHELQESGSGRETAAQLLRALGSLGDLAEDVLAVSGTPRAADEILALDDVIAGALLLARDPEARVRVALPSQGLHVRGHRGRLVHALFNLIDNACRVTPTGGVVRVRADQEGERVRIEVLDQGPGLPPGLEAVSEPVPSCGGSGFGLLATRRFLGSSGLAVVFDRLPEGGTRSSITLLAAN